VLVPSFLFRGCYVDWCFFSPAFILFYIVDKWYARPISFASELVKWPIPTRSTITNILLLSIHEDWGIENRIVCGTNSVIIFFSDAHHPSKCHLWGWRVTVTSTVTFTCCPLLYYRSYLAVAGAAVCLLSLPTDSRLLLCYPCCLVASLEDVSDIYI